MAFSHNTIVEWNLEDKFCTGEYYGGGGLIKMQNAEDTLCTGGGYGGKGMIKMREC